MQCILLFNRSDSNFFITILFLILRTTQYLIVYCLILILKDQEVTMTKYHGNNFEISNILHNSKILNQSPTEFCRWL